MDIDNYLDSMILSLERKEDTMQKILDHTKAEEILLKEPEFNIDKFDYHLDEKEQLIKLINVLDEGFSKTFKLVETQIKARPGLYSKQVHKMQDKIRKLTDIGIQIEAIERRNMPLVDKVVKDGRDKIKKYHVSQKVVASYYKQASGNVVNHPTMLDDRN